MMMLSQKNPYIFALADRSHSKTPTRSNVLFASLLFVTILVFQRFYCMLGEISRINHEFEVELDSSRQQITELEMDLQMLRGASNRRQTLPAGTFSGMGNVH